MNSFAQLFSRTVYDVNSHDVYGKYVYYSFNGLAVICMVVVAVDCRRRDLPDGLSVISG